MTKKSVSKKEVLKAISDLLLVILGTAVLAFGVAVFMVPYNLVAGGVAGIAIALGQIVHVEFLTVDVMVTILTWGIFFLGLIVLGKNFAMRTLVSSIVYPICLHLFMKLTSPDVFGGYFYLQGGMHDDIAMLVAAVSGGALVGIGCALTFVGGGSTGGTDIIAFVICKAFKRLKSSYVIFCVDFSVIILGVFAVKDIVVSILGVASAIVSAALIDKVFIGGQSSFIAQIISEKHEEIRQKILCDLNRGATLFDVVGAYSGENKKMIMVSFTMSQYNQVINIINKTDKTAFVTVHRAHEISGEGFTIPKGVKKSTK